MLVSKYADHLPLYRQAEIYAREGVELERSTLADWVGGSQPTLLEPLVEALRRYVMAAGKLHADDTPVPVLAPGNGKTKTGRLWTYVRDDRPAATRRRRRYGLPTRRIARANIRSSICATFRGTLQADAYAGFNQLYEGGRIAAKPPAGRTCGASFTTCMQAHASPIATEALERIGATVRDRERDPRPLPDERTEVRQARARPLLDSLHDVAAKLLCRAIEEVGYRGGDPLCAGTLDGAACATATTAAWRSTTTPPNGRCVPSRWAGRTTCSPDRIRRRACGRDLQPDRLGQTQRPRSRRPTCAKC